MPWNWQQPGWPRLDYDSSALGPLERQFLLRSGEFIGAFRHVGSTDKEEVVLKGGHVSIVAGPSAGKRMWPKLDQWLAPRSV